MPAYKRNITASPVARTARAFTLIEMITVLTIIIIVLAIAIPVWDALMNGTNLSSAQNEISAYLANARADAIFNRQMIGVCFFVDPKTQQTAMAEVQVQSLYQPHPPTGASPGSVTTSFFPGTWSESGSFSWFSWTAYPPPPMPATSVAPYSIELVNTPDPNNPGRQIFYRDIALLPKGAAVALTNNTYTYNYEGLWNATNPPGQMPTPWNAGPPPLDRYMRFGVIMFNPDGTLASVPFAVPIWEAFTSTQYGAASTPTPVANLLCQRMGIVAVNNRNALSDIASCVNDATQSFPLTTSVGLVLYDHDAYLTQHANPTQVMDNSKSPPQPVSIGDGSQFADADMNWSILGTYYSPPTTPNDARAQDKYLEEQWIDQHGTALLINPTSGSVIRAK